MNDIAYFKLEKEFGKRRWNEVAANKMNFPGEMVKNKGHLKLINFGRISSVTDKYNRPKLKVIQEGGNNVKK